MLTHEDIFNDENKLVIMGEMYDEKNHRLANYFNPTVDIPRQSQSHE
jgi:hypothetical protein